MVAVTHYGIEGNVVENRIVDVNEIKVDQGDNLVFLMTSKQVAHLRKTGDDLKIEFTDGHNLHVIDFFRRSRSDVETIITFKDTLYTSTELIACYESKGALVIEPHDVQVIHQHETEHLLKMDGSHDGLDKTSAYTGTSFLYHFMLDDEFPEDSKVEVLVNGKPMPEWMKIEKLSARKYMITGVPEKDYVGENKIDIKVHVPEPGDVIEPEEPEDAIDTELEEASQHEEQQLASDEEPAEPSTQDLEEAPKKKQKAKQSDADEALSEQTEFDDDFEEEDYGFGTIHDDDY